VCFVSMMIHPPGFKVKLCLGLKSSQMLIGYARVSTQDQNLDLQVDDKISGSRAERPGLTKALELLRENDMLGRNVKNLVNLVGELHNQGVQFKSLTDAIDTGTPSGRFFSMSWPV
jgi:DNA invertase Pin-like site-specific DNA recombinase